MTISNLTVDGDANGGDDLQPVLRNRLPRGDRDGQQRRRDRRPQRPPRRLPERPRDLQPQRERRLDNENAAHTLSVTGSTVTGFQKNGITANETGLTATISGNTVTGPDSDENIAQNGIQLGFGATGQILNNTVQDTAECIAASCGPDPVNDTQGTGILLSEAPGGVTVSGNTVTENDAGLLDDAGTGTHTVTSNDFFDNRFENVFLDDATMNLNGNEISGAPYGVTAIGRPGWVFDHSRILERDRQRHHRQRHGDLLTQGRRRDRCPGGHG